MARRPAVRAKDMQATLDALAQRGLKPCTLDVLPDGTVRWHFTPPVSSAEDDLDRELAAFEAKHGEG